MKMNKDLRQSYPVEFIDMMTDTGIMALVDWMAETKPGGPILTLEMREKSP